MHCPDSDDFVVNGEIDSKYLSYFMLQIKYCDEVAEDPEKECIKQALINKADIE